MTMDFFPLLLLFIGGLILTAGDIIMKQWVISHSRYWYCSGLIVYIAGMNFLAQSFRFKNIAVASVIFVLFNVISLLFVSWFYFQEKITIMKIFGLILGLIAIAIFELSY